MVHKGSDFAWVLAYVVVLVVRPCVFVWLIVFFWFSVWFAVLFRLGCVGCFECVVCLRGL